MTDLATVLQGAGDQLASSGHALVERFGALNFWTAALLAGALVLDRALSHRARASWRIALYAPVGARVLMPLDWSLHLAGAPRVVPFVAPPMRVGGTPDAGLSAGVAPHWYALVAVIYLAVVALLVARAIAARVRLDRTIAGARPVPGSLEGVPCPVVEHDDLGPMAVGLVAPRIVLPRRLLVAGEEHALGCVLRHEVAHLRRRDGWLSAAMQLLAIAAWPVVPLWLAIARVRQLVELACDEAALAGADASERRRYGHALLDIAAWRSLAVAPLGAGELHFGSTLRARIEALASQRHWPPAAQAIALSLSPIALIAACAAAGGEDRDYGYAFAADPAKTGAAAPASTPSPEAVQDGRVPPETIQAAVRSHFSAFQACYEAGLKSDPRLTGTVAVRYVFGDDGITKEAALDESTTLPDKDVGRCVAAEFLKVTYPKAKTGGVATVVYPIEFAP
jgi:Zn-dependent protease with chaperone function